MDVYMYYNNPFPFSILQPDILVHQSYEEVFLWFPATPLKSYFAPNHFQKYYVLHIYSNHNNLQYLLASDIPDTLLHFSLEIFLFEEKKQLNYLHLHFLNFLDCHTKHH